ncbi:Centromere protein X [Frankliniella fusca]|uniref:Centromere protein X n=1 Tax=Frankliniella fusca TaxID=407009 RepID=A0AAE1LNA1_9NEOP|nr:Centromere protein X [Frankliniella fusca]
MNAKDTVSNITASVRLEAIKHILKQQFKDPKTRIGDDTVRLVGEVVQVLIIEAAARSCNQALLAGLSVVEMEHVERVLPKLLLDF